MSASALRHDYVRRPAAPAEPAFSSFEHNSRVLRTEFNGGLAIGFVFGVTLTFVLFALCLWWAPLGWVGQ